MEHFTIFQDFYRVIAEMTEEEIVSAISNGTYRETVEDVRRIFAEQGEKAANEKKIELPEITFSANYRGGRSNATLVKYLGYIVVDIDHQTQEALARILALAKKCAHTRIAFISPKGMGLKIVVRVCRTDGTLPETIQEIEDFHHAAYHKIASFYAQLCGVEVDTSGQDVSRTCLFSYDPDIYFNPDFVSSAREEMLKKFPQIGDRKIILYAPTFRGNSILKSYMDLKLDIERMNAELSDDFVLLYKLHPQTAKRFSLSAEEREKYENFVFDISKDVRIDLAMCAADMLISDYSSVIFEYSLLSRPMIFFAYDLEEYDRDRSFYNKYEDFVPGPIVRDTEGIISAVRQAQSGFDSAEIENFRNYFMDACDGHSTARIAEAFMEK